MSNCDLLIQVDSKQALVVSNLTGLGTFPVETSFHKTLNVSRGALSNPDFIHVTEAEFLEELRDQGVCAARRINIRRDNKLIPTQHVVLTFRTPVLPSSIKAGYINCKIRPYIINPLRCFHCQRYGHSQKTCRTTIPVCGKCALALYGAASGLDYAKLMTVRSLSLRGRAPLPA